MKKMYLFSIFLLIIIFGAINLNATPLIRLAFPDTLVNTNVTHGQLSVYIDTYLPELLGFQFVLQSTRPDLVKFDFSGSVFDTTGTLTSGFEYVDGLDTLGDQSAVWFRCIADVSIIGGYVPGIPQQTGGVAVKINYTTTRTPDTTLPMISDLIIINPTDFSDRQGNSLGMTVDTLVDTTYYDCTNWLADLCLWWDEVSYPTDSARYDTSFVAVLDPEIVTLKNGSITLKILNCDIDGTGYLDIADLVCLVDYMFRELDPVTCPLLYCENDNNNEMDIADLVYFVDYMFREGPPPQEL